MSYLTQASHETIPEKIDVMTYNVYGGNFPHGLLALDSIRNEANVDYLLQGKAEIVMLQEVIGNALLQDPNIDEVYDVYRVRHFGLTNKGGLAILVRRDLYINLIGCAFQPMPTQAGLEYPADVPLFGGKGVLVLEMEMKLGRGKIPLNIVNTHLYSKANHPKHKEQVLYLLNYVKKLYGITIIGGDFNMQKTDPTFDLLTNHGLMQISNHTPTVADRENAYDHIFLQLEWGERNLTNKFKEWLGNNYDSFVCQYAKVDKNYVLSDHQSVMVRLLMRYLRGFLYAQEAS